MLRPKPKEIHIDASQVQCEEDARRVRTSHPQLVRRIQRLLLSAEACQARAAELGARGDEDRLAALGLGEHSGSYSTVAHDSLMYAMELTLKSAQMIDGYHSFNRDLGISGFVESFESGGLTYVYVRPIHWLDKIYGAETSDTMKTLERVAPVGRDPEGRLPDSLQRHVRPPIS